VVGYQPTGADGKVLLCRQRCAAVGFKPLQSRAFDASVLPRRWLARDSFPINGEAKEASDFRTRFRKSKNFLALSEGGEGGSAQSALTEGADRPGDSQNKADH